MTRITTMTLAVAAAGFIVGESHAAVTRYVAANGSWSSTSVWSTSSGGATGATAPNAAGDSALMNDASNNRALTLDIDVVLGTLSVTNRKYLDINQPATPKTITFGTTSGNATVSVTSSSTNQSGIDGDMLQIEPDVILDLTGKSLIVTQADRSDNTRTNRIAFRGSITGTGDITVTNNDDNNSTGGQTIFKAINSIGDITANPTSAGRIRFEGSIGSNVTSFTKNGNGVAALVAANTYTGGTTINAGTLDVGASGTLGSVAGLTIADGAWLNLLGNQISQGTINSLSLGAASYTTPGTYGSTASGATFTIDTHFAGTGYVTLVPEPGTLSLLGLAAVPMLRRRRA
jgi:autotransporter-associated beta strand protein